jgi:hypothetical protein
MLAASLSRSNRSPRKSRCSMTLMAAGPGLGDDPLAHGQGQAVGQRLGEVWRQELTLKSGQEERVDSESSL